MSRRSVGLLLGGLLLSSAAGVQAQILGSGVMPVTEVGPNLRMNTVTSFQSVLQTGYMAQELLSFGASPLDDSFGLDMEALDGLIQEAQGVLFDLQAIRLQAEHLFNLDTAPDSLGGLNQRMAEIRRARMAAQQHAQEIQTLAQRICNVTRRIRHLWDRILVVAGAKQNGQQVQAAIQQLIQVEAQSQVLQAAYQQVQLTQMNEEPLQEEAIQRIHTQVLADWPRP